MSYIYYNPNPDKKTVGDCVVRALSTIFNDSWNNVYADLSMQGAFLHDMPTANSIWGEYLKANGFRRYVIPNSCPHCYTVKDFCHDHPYGKYLLKTEGHVIAVVNGDYYDTANTGDEIPEYYWRKER